MGYLPKLQWESDVVAIAATMASLQNMRLKWS